MEQTIKIIEARILELKELITRVPVAKSFIAQARLAETEHILALLKKQK